MNETPRAAEQAPSSPSGDPVLLTPYSSNTRGAFDSPSHEAFSLASVDALFEAAEKLQEEYYTACQMDLEEALKTGLNSSGMVRYDRQSLQQRIYTLPENGEQNKAFLSCFGGNNPMLSRRRQVTKHLKGLDVEIIEMTIRLENRIRPFSFEGQAIPSMDQHEVLQVTMGNSEKYVIDIAGAQFELYNTIVPWQQYIDSHVRMIQGYRAFVYANL